VSSAHGIPHRPLGRTGVSVSCLGLGGFHLGLVSSSAEAERLVHAAVSEGITFMDSAWEYHGGESEARLGRALRGLGSKRHDVFLMTKCCSHGAGKAAALRQLDESLQRLGADHLDLWQLHEVIWDDDPQRYARMGGELEALAEAKQSGRVRFVGFTGHRDPALLAAMLATGFPFDTCQLPINAFDASFRSFGGLLPQLAARGLAALGMKSLSGSGDPVRAGVLAAEEATPGRWRSPLPL
jgi:aryl-alcohol dehydrogenase-like predicted oxidoreductase